MEIDNLSLGYVIGELAEVLEGAFVNKIQEVRKNVFKFKLRSQKGQKELLIVLDEHKAIYLTEYKLDARAIPHGYSLYLRKYLIGKKITGLEQVAKERIVKMSLGEYTLYIELFADGNLVLVKDDSIMMPLHREKFKDREIKKNIPYALPPAQGSNPLTVQGNELHKELNEGDTLFQAVMRNVNSAPVYVDEILQQEGLERKALAKEIKEKTWDAIANRLQELYSLQEKKTVNVIQWEKKPYLTAVVLKHFPAKQHFDSLSQGFDELLTKSLLEDEQKAIVQAVTKKKNALAFSLDAQEKAQKKFEKQAEEFQIQGEALYANLHVLEEVFEEIRKAIKQKKTKKEIMYKIHLGEEKGLIPKGLIHDIDSKKSKLFIEIK